MRLLHKEISKEGGRVTIIPDDAEDMWCLYNLIAIGDSVRTETVRKVVSETATGSVSGERLRVKLTIQVDFFFFFFFITLEPRELSDTQVYEP